MNSPRPEMHDQIPDVVARERDPRTGRITRLGNGDRRGKRESQSHVAIRATKSKKWFVLAGIVVIVLLLAGVAVASTSGGDSDGETAAGDSPKVTLPEGFGSVTRSKIQGGTKPEFPPVSVTPANGRTEPPTAQERSYGWGAFFECTKSGCEAQIVARTPPFVAKQTGDRFVAQQTSTGSCPNRWTADIRVLEWQDVDGIRFPARVSGRMTNTLLPSDCQGLSYVYEGTSAVEPL
jgi:hypothetical protein